MGIIYFFITLIFLFFPLGRVYATEYQSVIPTLDTSHVKATSDQSGNYPAWRSCDPSKSLTAGIDNQWIADGYQLQRFHIDLGSLRTIKRIYFENSHDSGTDVYSGIQNFTFWGSNSEDAFNDTAYTHDTNWTQITLDRTSWNIHIESASSDPQYATTSGTTQYRYYALKIEDSYRQDYFMGFRRIELQEEAGTPTPTAIPTPTPTPILEPLPIATTSAQLASTSLIYYKLYMRPFGPCTLIQSCGQDLMMTIYNNTDEWTVTRVNWTPNYGFTGITLNPEVTAGTINSFYTNYFYYHNDHNLEWLKDHIHDVSFVINNVSTQEEYEIPAPAEGEYLLIDPTDSGGLTIDKAITPTDQCGLIDLGLIRIPDFFCQFKAWIYGFINYLFVPDMPVIQNKLTQLVLETQLHFPWAIMGKLADIQIEPIDIRPMGTQVSEIPAFHLEYNNKFNDQTVFTTDLTVQSDRFDGILPSLNNMRNFFSAILIIGWVFHAIYLCVRFLLQA